MIRSLLYLLLRRVLGLVGPNDRMPAEAELEIAVLRHQVTILRRQVKRPVYRTSDRAFLAAASRMLSARGVGGVPGSARDPPAVAPAAGEKEVDQAAPRPGRPSLHPEVRELILRLGRENPRWGYMRIRGELLKLGVRVSATTIAIVLRRAGMGCGAPKLDSPLDRGARSIPSPWFRSPISSSFA